LGHAAAARRIRGEFGQQRVLGLDGVVAEHRGIAGVIRWRLDRQREQRDSVVVRRERIFCEQWLVRRRFVHGFGGQ